MDTGLPKTYIHIGDQLVIRCNSPYQQIISDEQSSQNLRRKYL